MTLLSSSCATSPESPVAVKVGVDDDASSTASVVVVGGGKSAPSVGGGEADGAGCGMQEGDVEVTVDSSIGSSTTAETTPPAGS